LLWLWLWLWLLLLLLLPSQLPLLLLPRMLRRFDLLPLMRLSCLTEDLFVSAAGPCTDALLHESASSTGTPSG
jgi:hypothetical protein